MSHDHSLKNSILSSGLSLVVSVKTVNYLQREVSMIGAYLHYAGCGNMTTQVGL